MGIFDERKPLDDEQPLDEIDREHIPKIIVLGLVGGFVCLFGVAMTSVVLYEAFTVDAQTAAVGQSPTIIGAASLAITVWVAVALVFRGLWMAFQGARGRDSGPFVTERVGWFMAIGWGVPLVLAVGPSFSWSAIVEQPVLSGVVALAALFLIRAPMVGRSLDRNA